MSEGTFPDIAVHIRLHRDPDKRPITVEELPEKPCKHVTPDAHGTGWEVVWYYVKESPETQDILKVQLFWPVPFIKVLTPKQLPYLTLILEQAGLRK